MLSDNIRKIAKNVVAGGGDKFVKAINEMDKAGILKWGLDQDSSGSGFGFFEVLEKKMGDLPYKTVLKFQDIIEDMSGKDPGFYYWIDEDSGKHYVQFEQNDMKNKMLLKDGKSLDDIKKVLPEGMAKLNLKKYLFTVGE